MAGFRGGQAEDCDKIMLDSIKPGGVIRVIRVANHTGGKGRLANLGIGPGVGLEVLAVHPFQGPVVVRMNGVPVAIGRGLARNIEVEVLQAIPLHSEGYSGPVD